MRNMRLLGWAAVLSGAMASPAFGQTTSSSNSLGSTTGASGANSVGSSSGTGGNTGSASSGGSTLATTSLATVTTPPINPPVTTQTASSNQAISSSNAFQYTYGAVLYQGRAGANTTSNNPGGLGTPLFNVTSGTGTTTGGAGGATRGGSGSTIVNDTAGVTVQLPRNIAYQSYIKFARPPISSDRLQADLRGTISRSSSLTNPAGVQVQVVGNDVTVRGTVRNGDEARLVEGLIRLTPGVGVVKNELAALEP